MEALVADQLMDEITEFFASAPTLEQVAEYKVSEALDQRLHDLLDKNSSEALTDAERAELNNFLRMGHFLRMIKIKARLRLAGEG